MWLAGVCDCEYNNRHYSSFIFFFFSAKQTIQVARGSYRYYAQQTARDHYFYARIQVHAVHQFLFNRSRKSRCRTETVTPVTNQLFLC